MADKREKSISYRRAQWLVDDPASINLASCIKQAAVKLTTVAERTVPRNNGKFVRLAMLSPESKGGLYLHLTEDTPGELASVVPKAISTSTEIEVSTTAPPSGAEFMDGDAFLYVNENDVCLCSTGMRDASIQYFLQDFFKQAKIRSDAVQFMLAKVSDVSKIKLIQNQGIREIEIRAILYEATLTYNRRKAQAQSIVGAAAKHIRYVLGNEHDVNSDALQVALSVKTDRRRKGLKLGEKRIQTLATDLIKHQEGDDDFVIITKKNQRIGPNEIFIKTTVEIDSIGKSAAAPAAQLPPKGPPGIKGRRLREDFQQALDALNNGDQKKALIFLRGGIAEYDQNER